MSKTVGRIEKINTDHSIPYIDHTALITHGNSGGPLLAMNGVVLGVTNGSHGHVENQSEVIEDEVHSIPAQLIPQAFPRLFPGE